MLTHIHALQSPLINLAEYLLINVIGTAAVNEALLPLLRRGRARRIWVVGSRAGTFAHGWSRNDTAAACMRSLFVFYQRTSTWAYNLFEIPPDTASKAALHLWTVSPSSADRLLSGTGADRPLPRCSWHTGLQVKLARALAPEGFTVIAFSPG